MLHKNNQCFQLIMTLMKKVDSYDAETDVEESLENNTTSGNDSPTNLRFELISKLYGLKKYKKPWKICCGLCKSPFSTIKELNKHHKKGHDIQFCDDCNKGFSTLTTLTKHRYVHRELSFNSHLAQHKIIQRKLSSHVCMAKGCTKSFKNKPDLTQHVKIHSKRW